MICECTWKITFKGNKTYMPTCRLATTYIPCCWCLKMIPIITNRTNNNVPCEKKALQCISQWKSQPFVWWDEYIFTPWASNDSTYLMISSFISIKKIIEELFIVNVVVEVVEIVIVVLCCIVAYLFLFLLSLWSLLSLQSLLLLLLTMMFFLLLGTK